MTYRRPKGGVNQDSKAWHLDAHALGEDYANAHQNDPGTLPGQNLFVLATKLFQEDPETPGLLNLYRLQKLLRESKEDPTAFSQPLVDSVNQLITELIDDGKVYTMSYAQIAELWHALVDQADLKLLAPKPPGAMYW